MRKAAAVAFGASRGNGAEPRDELSGIPVGHDRVELAAVRVGNPQDDAVGVEYGCRGFEHGRQRRGYRPLAPARVQRDATRPRSNGSAGSLWASRIEGGVSATGGGSGSLASRKDQTLPGTAEVRRWRCVQARPGRAGGNQQESQRPARPRRSPPAISSSRRRPARISPRLSSASTVLAAWIAVTITSVFSSPSEKIRSDASKR